MYKIYVFCFVTGDIEMADSQQHSSSIKHEDVYEKLRGEGASKEKAARIANSMPQAGKKGGKSKPYEERTKKELYEQARNLDIVGRSDMSKNELIDALRNH
jgi:hypothetical protein